jgi:ribosome-associated protein
MKMLEIAKLAFEAALEKKAKNPVVFHIGPMVGYTDYALLATGTTSRQVNAIAKSIEKTIIEVGEKIIGTEGKNSGDWVIIDAGAIVIHVLTEESREYYSLDSLWKNCEQPFSQIEELE